MAECGACTVIMGGRVVRSCVVPVSAVGQNEVTTLEGLGTPEQPHPIQQAFIEEGAAQCGFCLSGVILTAKAVLDVKPNASDAEDSRFPGRRLVPLFCAHSHVAGNPKIRRGKATMMHSRRRFLKGCGVLIVSFSAGPLSELSAEGPGPFDTHLSHVDPQQLDSWLAVGADGSITAYTGKCDFGQGIFTAQSQLVAEELCVPLARVKLFQCDTSVTPDQGTTSGSQSTPTNFNLKNLALAAATAREALLSLAATKLGEPLEQLTLADAVITGRTGRRVRYEELIGNQRFNLPLSATAKRRSPADWTVLREINSFDGQNRPDDWSIRVRSRYSSLWNATRACRAPSRDGSGSCPCGRTFGAECSRSYKNRGPQGFCRCRRRNAARGRIGGPSVGSSMESRPQAPAAEEFFRLSPGPAWP